MYFGTRSDAKFNEKNNMWYGTCSLLVQSIIDIPEPGYTLSAPLIPGSRMTNEQVQQSLYKYGSTYGGLGYGPKTTESGYVKPKIIGTVP